MSSLIGLGQVWGAVVCVRARWRVFRRYSPGFQGSKTSFINGRGTKLDADLTSLLKSTPSLSLALKQQVTHKVWEGQS